MKIIHDSISLEELKKMASEGFFDNMVKAVVDVEKELVALDLEMHADLEALLLEEGSKQGDLWGINLYPQASPEEWIEFDSMINLRPSFGNRTRGVDDEGLREKIKQIVAKRIKV